MTLIAAGRIEGCPVLIGDLIVSIPHTGETLPRVALPTHVDANRSIPPEWGRVIRGCLQKLIRIDEHLAVAWAGSEIAAGAVLRDLATISGPRITAKAVRGFLENIDYLRTLSLSLIVMVSQRTPDDTGSIVAWFGWDSKTGFQRPLPVVGPYRDVNVFGSGSHEFLTAATTTLVSHPSRDDVTVVERGLLPTLGLVGTVIGEQIRTEAGLASFWGGGFECVAPVDGRLEKIGDTTYVFLEVAHRAGGAMEMTIPAVIKLAYVDDVLVLRRISLRLLSDGVASQHEGNDDRFFVLRPDRQVLSEAEVSTLIALPSPPLASKFSVFYAYRTDVSPPRVKALVHYAGKRRSAVEFEEGADGTVTFTMREETVVRIQRL